MTPELNPLQQAASLVDAGQWQPAEVLLRKLIAQQPGLPAAHYLFGLVLVNTDRMAEAAEAFQRARQLQPGLVAAWLNQAAAFGRLDQPEAAYALLQEALQCHPQQVELLTAVGRAAIRLEHWPEAQAWLEQALSLGGRSSSCLAHLGIARLEQGDAEAAVGHLRDAVALDPTDHHARYHLALALKDVQRLEEALAQLNQVAALDPGYPGLHGNRAILLFLLGRYSEAWPEYAWRFAETPQILERPPLPHYEPAMGRVDRLLVLAEQGLGDSLQFVRYIAPLARHAKALRLVVQPALLPLLQRAFPEVEVLPAPWDASHLEGVDAWLPLLSAAQLLGVAAEQPLVSAPYLQAPPDRIGWWRDRLGVPSGPRVALVWQGNPQAERGHQRARSMPLQALEPLLDQPGLEWISLQRGRGSEQLDALGWRSRFHPLQAEIDAVWPFEEVAAILHSCDLLISTDTAITHLAGACGLPALLLLKSTPDWRWGLSGEATGWYSNHRLFRQRQGETWEATVQRLARQPFWHRPATV